MRAASAAKGTQQETASPLTFHTPSSPLANWISQLIPAVDYWYTLLPVKLALMIHQLTKHLSFFSNVAWYLSFFHRWIIQDHIGGLSPFTNHFRLKKSLMWVKSNFSPNRCPTWGMNLEVIFKSINNCWRKHPKYLLRVEKKKVKIFHMWSGIEQMNHKHWKKYC